MRQKNFIEVTRVGIKVTVKYRFYGQGRWKINLGSKWCTINAIYIPAQVLAAAAERCCAEQDNYARVKVQS